MTDRLVGEVRTRDAVRFTIRIGRDIVRVVRQDDYDVAAAIAKAFQSAREDGEYVHMPSGSPLVVTVERTR